MRMLSGLSERHQHRDQHHAGAVRRGHDERPGGKSGEPGFETDAQAVAMSVSEVIDAPPDQERAGKDAERGCVDRHAEDHHRIDDNGDCRRVAERDGNEGDEHHLAALPVEPECHGKEPAHGRIEPMKSAERHQHQPR